MVSMGVYVSKEGILIQASSTHPPPSQIPTMRGNSLEGHAGERLLPKPKGISDGLSSVLSLPPAIECQDKHEQEQEDQEFLNLVVPVDRWTGAGAIGVPFTANLYEANVRG